MTNQRSTRIGTTLILLMFSLVAHAQQADHLIGKNKTGVVPEKFLRAYDPITVFFPKPVGPENGGPLDEPGEFLRIEPQHPGEYRWLDAQTLQFVPTVAWPALEKYTISAQGHQHQLVTLMSRPKRVVPRIGSSGLPPIELFTLSFSQPMNIDRLARMIRIEVRPSPGLGGEGYWLTGEDLSIKAMERASLQDDVAYVVELDRPIDYGHTARLHLRLSLDETHGESLVNYTFTTKPLFRLAGIGAAEGVLPLTVNGANYTREQAVSGGSGVPSLYLEFSDYPGEISLEQVKALVRFEPSVRNLSHSVNGRRLNLRFEAARDLAYRISLRHVPIHDREGRVLTRFGDSSAFVYFKQAPAFVRWQQSQGILERYGSQEFPMEARASEKVDLRIYKIEGLDRNFWPFRTHPLAVDESVRPAGPGEEPAPNQTIHDEYIRQLGSPLISRIVSLPSAELGGGKFGLNLEPHLSHISGVNAPGTYLIGYRALGGDANRYYARVQVTDLSLSVIEEENAVVFVVTSASTGKPIQGARVTLEGLEHDDAVVKLIEGTTDTAGMYRYQHTSFISPRIYRLYVRQGEDLLVVDPASPPPFFFDNHYYYANSWLQWLREPPAEKKTEEVPLAYIYSERPMYKPEEPVHLRGYLRLRKQGNLLPAGSDSYVLQINGPGGKSWTFTPEFDPVGNFYVKFEEEKLPSGFYSAILVNEAKNWSGGFVEFQKEAYRIPRFEVRLDSPQKTPLDKPFQVLLTADYYAGGRVVDQEVNWNITSRPYTYRAPSWPGFLFSSDERFRSTPARPETEADQRFARTDQNGSATLELDPTRENDSQPRQYLVSATVKGADEQTVTANRQVVALPPLILGLKAPRLLKPDETLKTQVIVLGSDDAPLASQEVKVRVLHRQWHSYLMESDFTTGEARYVTEVVDEPIHEATVTSKKEALELEYQLEEAGVYIVELSARDRLGRLQKVSNDLFRSGEEPMAWQKPKERIFEATWDKKEYLPGDQATLVLQSPYQQARALVVVEHPDRNTYHWIEVSNGQGLFSMEITAEMTPTLPVHVLLMRGRVDRGADERRDLGRPAATSTTSWIKVKPVAFELDIALKHEAQQLPGKTMQMRVEVKDTAGNPVDGEVTLWLVDRAVLALAKESNYNLLERFLPDHRSWLRIRDTRNEFIGRLPLEPFPGGDGGGSDGLFDKVTVRKNFKTVPFYRPGIQVIDGVALLEIPLPDNLTDFAIRAIATSGANRFGVAKSKVSVRLPLIVQSALPRFVRPGDYFVAGGIGRVVEGEGGPGAVAIRTEGVQMEGAANNELTWEKDRPIQLTYPMTVTEQAAIGGEETRHITVSLAVSRDADGASDAFEVKLPVRPDRDWEVRERFATPKEGEPLLLLDAEEEARAGTLQREVMLTHEPGLIKMLAALDYLAAYPHGCAEQRVSQLMPELLLREKLAQIGRERTPEALTGGMRETLRFLVGATGENGLVGYWPGSRGFVSLTAYVVEFLALAREQGFEVDETWYQRMLTALNESLRSDIRYSLRGYEFVERARAIAALARAGRFDRNYAFELAARAQTLSLESEAALLVTLMEQQAGEPATIEKMRTDLQKSLIYALRDGEEAYQGLQYRSESWGGLILTGEVRTMAQVTRALYKSAPEDKRTRTLVTELINLGEGDGWGSTRANSAALQALGEVMDNPHTASTVFTLEHGATSEELDTSGQLITRFETSETGVASLRYLRGSQPLPQARMRLRYLPTSPGSQVHSENKGFAVERELENYGDDPAHPTRHRLEAGQTLAVKLGSVLEEHVRVINPEDRLFVAIRVPFAAGLEPLNPNLATAPPEAQPKGSLTLEPSYAHYEDDQVTYYYNELPKGTYDIYFRLKATIEGSFTHPAARAELMYRQQVYGRGNGARIDVQPRQE